MKIKKIVDLSIPITNTTPVYPGDPEPALSSAATIQKDGYNVSNLQIGSHTGTHIDAPYHIAETGWKIEDIPLEQLIGEGVVMNVTGKLEGEAIVLADIEPYLDMIAPGKIVLFHTGWSAYLNEAKYFRHPYIHEEVFTFLISKGIRVFFIDALNIDPPDGSSFIGHEIITAVNGIIGENFTDFDKIDFEHPLIISLPLPLAGIDGSPVRAVAIELEEAGK